MMLIEATFLQNLKHPKHKIPLKTKSGKYQNIKKYRIYKKLTKSIYTIYINKQTQYISTYDINIYFSSKPP